MDLAHTLAGWRRTLHERVFDRARAATFARFLWRRFLDDRLFDAAASLSYTTAFALVPLAVVVLGVLSAFPVFQQWSAELVDYVFSHFMPSAARAIATMSVTSGLSLAKAGMSGGSSLRTCSMTSVVDAGSQA